MKNFRPVKEESLEIDEAGLTSSEKLFAGVNFFRQHAAWPRAVLLNKISLPLGRSIFQVDLNNVSKFGEEFAWVAYPARS